jgi:hypothetical protein
MRFVPHGPGDKRTEFDSTALGCDLRFGFHFGTFRLDLENVSSVTASACHAVFVTQVLSGNLPHGAYGPGDKKTEFGSTALGCDLRFSTFRLDLENVSSVTAGACHAVKKSFMRFVPCAREKTG